MATIDSEALQVVAETTGATVNETQWSKAVKAIETGRAVIYGQGEQAKVAIDSDTQKGLTYRFGVNERCCCKAAANDRMCWHRVCADILSVQQAITNRDNAQKRQAAKARIAQPVAVAAGGNALDALFNLNLPNND